MLVIDWFKYIHPLIQVFVQTFKVIKLSKILSYLAIQKMAGIFAFYNNIVLNGWKVDWSIGLLG